MAEYIKKEDAKAAIKKRIGSMDLFESRFNADIDAIPAADVVEVVRCKDCAYFDPGEIPFCRHTSGLGDNDENDFCSLGNRRADYG